MHDGACTAIGEVAHYCDERVIGVTPSVAHGFVRLVLVSTALVAVEHRWQVGVVAVI